MVMMADAPRPQIQSQLDALPVFAVANEEGKPLQYQVDGKPMAIFYADVDVAKDELEKAKEQHPDLNCDVIPVGLGAAYRMSCEGTASLVPSVTDLRACGMPEGLSAMGQELPLFACMEMHQQTEEGATVLPLYMSHADCEAAVTQAREAAGDPDLEVVGLSLPGVVEHLTGIADDTPTFAFVAPTSSTEHVSSYVGQGVYYRLVDEEES